MNLASRLSDLAAVQGSAPWPDHEYVKGWGVFGLPFDSGHVLALRVFPENDFAPYRTLWHRDPEGRWTIYVDGPRLDTCCPRYYGSARDYTGFASIGLTWTGPSTLRVTMRDPTLDWVLFARVTPLLRVINAFSIRLPLATWTPSALIHARQRLARALGLGRLQMSGVMPSGHTGTLMPQQMYFIDNSRATFAGIDLGAPVRLADNPTIGEVPLPARGMLAIGQAVCKIADVGEYTRTRNEARVRRGDPGPTDRLTPVSGYGRGSRAAGPTPARHQRS